MKTAVFSAKDFDRTFLLPAAQNHGIDLTFFETRLDSHTASLAAGFKAIAVFANDDVNAKTVDELARVGVGLIALRGAGFNHVDLEACAKHSIRVVRVPEYSPYSVAEHTFGLILSLNRKIHKAYNRVREGNFSLNGLMGFDLFGKTIGIIGAGRIGGRVARIAHGFGMQVLLVDPYPEPVLKDVGEYCEFETLAQKSDVITLHCPLAPNTWHLINGPALDKMKSGVMLVNTSRGALVDTRAVIARLKTGFIGSLAIDVYEEEAGMFFKDQSLTVMQDDVFARLLTFPNVLITGHQAFFTREALHQIAETTAANILAWTNDETLENEVIAPALIQ